MPLTYRFILSESHQNILVTFNCWCFINKCWVILSGKYHLIVRWPVNGDIYFLKSVIHTVNPNVIHFCRLALTALCLFRRGIAAVDWSISWNYCPVLPSHWLVVVPIRRQIENMLLDWRLFQQQCLSASPTHALISQYVSERLIL